MRTIGLPALKVFLSHSVTDLSIVTKLFDLLSVSGITVYIAELQPQPGALISEKVEKLIKESDYFLALLTRDGQRSPFVNYEIGIAKGFNKPIIPLVEEGVQLPLYLQQREVLWFKREGPERTVEWLIEYLNHIRKEKARAALMSALATLSLVAIIGIGLLGLFSLISSGNKGQKQA
ncbi:MAG: toll/interleukin-1 receptor domain-containing protein [Candidatus Bathyarchaeia archaeon]